MYKFIILIIFGSFVNCQNLDFKIPKAIDSISKENLFKHISIIASDSLSGRKTGEVGHKMVVDYIVSQYKKMKIHPPKDTVNYRQSIPKNRLHGASYSSENVLAYIPGTDSSGEYIIISAHSDHIGIINGEIYNGADDNGSGTSALLEIANTFKLAEKEGFKPKKGILFLHFTGEELGLLGSKYYVQNPVLPLNKVICDINIDMIGRIDDKHTDSNYIYSIGSDRITPKLKELEVNLLLSLNDKLVLDFSYDEDDEMRLYYRSDHYNFAEKKIPVTFFFSGLHQDYHQPTDDVQKIDLPGFEKRVKYLFAFAWTLSNVEGKFKN